MTAIDVVRFLDRILLGNPNDYEWLTFLYFRCPTVVGPAPADLVGCDHPVPRPGQRLDDVAEDSSRQMPRAGSDADVISLIGVRLLRDHAGGSPAVRTAGPGCLR